MGGKGPGCPALPTEQLSAATTGGRMTRRFPGLHRTSAPSELSDGIYLVRVERVQYRWHAQKPHYSVRFAVLEPKPWAGVSFAGRLYCTEKALWKLSWFLRDF